MVRPLTESTSPGVPAMRTARCCRPCWRPAVPKPSASSLWASPCWPPFVAPKKLVRLAYRDVGLDYYGNGIIASEELIAKEPDTVRRFVAATLRGMADAFVDPAMAGRTIAHYQQQIKPEIGAAEIEQVRALAVDAGRKLGAIDPAKIVATVRVIAGAYTLNKPASPEEMWAAGFVP